jgi:hypothetical protein
MVVSRDVPLCACLTSVSHTEPRPPQSPLSHISFSLASHSITRRTRSLRSLYALTPSHDTAQMKRCRCSLTIRCTSRQRHKRLQGIPTTWLSNQTGCLSSGICWCVHVCICAPTLTWRGAILLCAPPCAHPSPHAACTTTVVSVCVRVQWGGGGRGGGGGAPAARRPAAGGAGGTPPPPPPTSPHSHTAHG